MEIRIQISGNVYVLAIGFKTEWVFQSSFITIYQEWRDENMQVVMANEIFSLWDK